ECGVDRVPPADDRGADHGYPGGQAGGCAPDASRGYVLDLLEGAPPPFRRAERASRPALALPPPDRCAGKAGARTRSIGAWRRHRCRWEANRIAFHESVSED